MVFNTVSRCLPTEYLHIEKTKQNKKNNNLIGRKLSRHCLHCDRLHFPKMPSPVSPSYVLFSHDLEPPPTKSVPSLDHGPVYVTTLTNRAWWK